MHWPRPEYCDDECQVFGVADLVLICIDAFGCLHAQGIESAAARGHYAGEGEALAPVAPCLHAACAQHPKLALAAATGQGSDRRLFALRAIAAEVCARVSHSSKRKW